MKSKQRVMIVSHHYQPEIGAASSRLTHVARHLGKRGIEVFVVTSKPNYPDPELYKEENVKKLDAINKQEGVQVYRSPAITFLSSGKLSRLLNQLLFVFFAIFRIFWLRVRYKVKVCITTSPPFIINFVGWIARKIGRMRWIMEVRDLWPESMVAVDFMDEDSKIYRFLKWMEYYFYKVCSEIVVVTESTATHLRKNQINPDKITVITNGIPDWILKYSKLSMGQHGSKEEKLDDKEFCVLYIGNLGLSQNLHVLISAASLVKEHTIKIYFVGEGLQKLELKNKAKELNLKNVEFIPGVIDKQELFSWYKKADLGIVCLKEAELFYKVIPSKIFEYAGANVPILFVGKGEAAEMIQTYDLGERVEYDANAIAKKLLIRKSPSHTRIRRNTNEKFIKAFAWEQHVEYYLRILKKTY